MALGSRMPIAAAAQASPMPTKTSTRLITNDRLRAGGAPRAAYHFPASLQVKT